MAKIKSPNLGISEINNYVAGLVINQSGPEGCQWVIKLKDNKEVIPINWPVGIKKHNQKIMFSFRLSRAQQPECFKGQMIVIEKVSIL